MAALEITFDLISVPDKIKVTMINCYTGDSYVSDKVINPVQYFENLKLGVNKLLFQIEDGNYLLEYFKFKLEFTGTRLSSECETRGVICEQDCEPNWEDTTDFRCIQVDGENTGEVEQLQIDINCGLKPRWINKGINLDKCSVNLTPDWNQDKFKKQCNLSGTTRYTIFVKGNGIIPVEFYESGQWNASNVGINGYQFNLPSDGICHDVKFRLQGTTEEHSGCVQSYFPNECSASNVVPSPIITPTISPSPIVAPTLPPITPTAPPVVPTVPTVPTLPPASPIAPAPTIVVPAPVFVPVAPTPTAPVTPPVAPPTTPIPTIGTLQIVEQFAKGLSGDVSYTIDNDGQKWYYPPTDEMWSNIKITVNLDYTINIIIDDRGWVGNGDEPVYLLDISDTWLTKAQVEAINFSNMKGRDLSIITARTDAGGVKDVKQIFVHFKGDNTTNLPSFYVRNPTQRLPLLPSFPTFSLPNKFNILQFGQMDNSNNVQNVGYINRGYTLVDTKGHPTLAAQPQMLDEYDTWCYNHGCPSGNPTAAVAWFEAQTMSNLISWYTNEVINPSIGRAFLFHDMEQWYYSILGSDNGCNKLASLFKLLKQINPTIKFATWVGGKGTESSYYPIGLTPSRVADENAKYSQTFNQVAREYFAKPVQYLNAGGTPTGETGYLGDHLDVVICGNYLNYGQHTNLYSAIQEMELAKIHFPTKERWINMWSYIEPVPGSDLGTGGWRKYLRTNGTTGQAYFIDFKPACPFSHMHSIGSWGNYMGTGNWMWHDPYFATEKFQYWGGAGKDPLTATNLGFSFVTPNGADVDTRLGMVEVSTPIGYDFSTIAMFELSFNDDIYANIQPVTRPDYSLDGGTTWKTGVDLLPASAEYNKLPIVRLQRHNTLNEWLLVAVDQFQPAYQNKTIKVKIGTLIRDILLEGQYTSIKRIQLV